MLQALEEERSKGDVMLTDFVLVADAKLQQTDEELGRLIGDVKHEYAIDAEDYTVGCAFRRYLLFARWPSLLQGSVPDLAAADAYGHFIGGVVETRNSGRIKHNFANPAFEILVWATLTLISLRNDAIASTHLSVIALSCR
jgi:hypothetical protein